MPREPLVHEDEGHVPIASRYLEGYGMAEGGCFSRNERKALIAFFSLTLVGESVFLRQLDDSGREGKKKERHDYVFICLEKNHDSI